LKIIDFKKKKFLKECREYLKSGKVSDTLSMAINNSTPGHIEFLKNDMSDDEKQIIDIVVKRIRKTFQKNITSQRQKINMLSISALENLSTLNKSFIIPEVIERYRDTINPIKALYYDLQEIMFLYDGKSKKEHHRFLIDRFSDIEYFSDIILAVDKDIEDLYTCKEQLKAIATSSSIANSGEYAVRVYDTHSQLIQWKKLFERFPDWVKENENNKKISLCETLKKFFNNE
jgi:hypothetical protein